jgi:membrane dipeptidase
MSFPLIDAHCDTVRLFALRKKDYDFKRRNTCGHLDLPRLKEAGFLLQIFALYIEEEYKPVGSLKRTLQLLDLLTKNLERCREETALILNRPDLDDLQDQRKIGVLISIEGGEALEGEVAVLRMLFRLGVRALGLTWNQENQLAVGVGNGTGGRGLSALGRRVIKEMNRLGMLVDLAHINEKGFYEALETSSKPVVVSHANSRHLCNHPRNLSDQQLKALAEKGGVIGLSCCPAFVDQQKATVDRLLDHFGHVAEIAGVDTLALGSDFDGIDSVIPGLEDVSAFPALVEGLGKRGFNRQEIAKITSENMLRVLDENLPA